MATSPLALRIRVYSGRAVLALRSASRRLRAVHVGTMPELPATNVYAATFATARGPARALVTRSYDDADRFDGFLLTIEAPDYYGEERRDTLRQAIALARLWARGAARGFFLPLPVQSARVRA